ncbi:MAG: aldo/keto reductase, partial [Xanthomonadales bacterium]|nr:aldo/keto reductase [Xanthomonadales bacterium]
VGTNAFGTEDPDALARIRGVLETLPQLGGRVVDTAQSYGRSEAVIGQLVQGIGNRESLFIATKTASRGRVSMADIDAAFARLGVERLDLLQVHNFNETDAVMPMMLELKAQGRVRYVGCSTSRDSQYGDLKAAMSRHPLDFIQVDYSIDNRSAADEILPLARDRGIAVLGNMPFGGRRNASSTFSRVAEVELPDWAGDIDVNSWAQFFLKYSVSHPAMTVAIPGTTKPHHLEDNLGAARGRLPDAAMRLEMERLWDSI